MIIIVTFRIPGGAVGALCAFILSRENLLSTAKSALSIVMAFAIGALFIPIGARMFASTPFTHFLWQAASLFLIFFLLRTLQNFALATGLGLVGTNILAIWYLPGPAEHNVALTLWQVLGALIGALVTFAVEARLPLLQQLRRTERWPGKPAQQRGNHVALLCSRRANPSGHQSRALTQYAVVGVGSLRRLRRAAATTTPLNACRRAH